MKKCFTPKVIRAIVLKACVSEITSGKSCASPRFAIHYCAKIAIKMHCYRVNIMHVCPLKHSSTHMDRKREWALRFYFSWFLGETKVWGNWLKKITNKEVLCHTSQHSNIQVRMYLLLTHCYSFNLSSIICLHKYAYIVSIQLDRFSLTENSKGTGTCIN